MKPPKPPLSRKERSEIWKSFWLHAVAATGFIIITSIAAMIVQAGAGESLSLLIYLIQGVLNFLVWARFVKRIEKYKDSTGITYPLTYFALAFASFILFVGPLVLFVSLLIRLQNVPSQLEKMNPPEQQNAPRAASKVLGTHWIFAKSKKKLTRRVVSSSTPVSEPAIQLASSSVAPPSTEQPIPKPLAVQTAVAASPSPSQPKPPMQDSSMDDDDSFYEEVAKEIESNTLKPGLWTRAFAEANGSHDLARALYIRLRVAQLVRVKQAELREIQRLEDERIMHEEKARLQAAKLEAAELERKEKEAEAALEKRLEEQRRLQEQKQRTEEERRKKEEKEEEEAAKNPAQIRKMAAKRLKKDLENLACYSTRICDGETYFYLFKRCLFYVSSDEILFIPKVCKGLPTEILVSRKLGDYIKMTLGIYEPGVTGIIHLKNGTRFRLNLGSESKKALREWAKR